MRKATALVTCGVAVLALGTGIWLGVRALQTTLHNDLPVAAVLPADVLYYVEAHDLREHWDALRRTDSWKDLQASDVARSLRDEGALAALREELDDLSEKVKYDLRGENLLKFVGDEAAVAIWMDEHDELQPILVARIDVEALTLDLLAGEEDWRELQEELNRRAASADVSVGSAPRGEYSITRAAKGEDVAFSTLLEDLLVVSPSEAAVKKAVDLRVAEGRGSLHARPAFRREVDALPEERTVTDWINVKGLRKRRHVVQREFEIEQSIEPYLAAVSAESLARSIEVPEGDLYQVHWTWSREQQRIFQDSVSPELRDVFPPGAVAYLEARRLRQLGEAWRGSSIKRHIDASWLAEQFHEWLADAEEQVRALSPLELPEEVREATDDDFALRFGGHLVKSAMGSALGADAAVALWLDEEADAEQPAEGLAALRLDTDGRMVELAARAALDAAAKKKRRGPEFVRATHGDREIRGVPRGAGGNGVYWVQAGDLLLVGSNVEILRAALDRVDAGPGGAADAEVSEAIAHFDPGYRLFLYYDLQAVVRVAQASDPQDRVLSVFGALLADTGMSSFSSAVYVADDLSQIDFRWRIPLHPDTAPDSRGMQGNVAVGVPRTFELLPETTIGARSVLFDAESVWRTFDNKDIPGLTGRLDEALSSVERELDIDVPGELLPAVGPEFAYAMTLETEPRSAEIPPIPGFALFAEVRESAPVEKLLQNIAAFLERKAEGDAAAAVVREEFEGSTLLRVEFSEASGIPLTPAATVLDGFLVAVSDVSLLDALIASRDGDRVSLARSPLEARVRASGIRPDGHDVARLDWNLLLDQIAVYAPQIAEITANLSDAGIEYPEFPQQGGMEEWNRRREEYEERVRRHAESKRGDVLGAIDSFRFIDFMAGSSRQSGDAQQGMFVIRFVE